jgi:dihydropteroate synthase
MTPFPKLVGILNITPDSFSDGGNYDNPKRALHHVDALIDDGADMIDIGAQSTRAGAVLLSYDQEWQRLEPVLAQVVARCHAKNIQVSLDSIHPENVARAIALGVDMVNDQSGGENPVMVDVLKTCAVPVVIMHHLGIPTDKKVTLPAACDPVEMVLEWAKARITRLEGQGIDRSRIIFDPGVGFGKTATQSLVVLRRIEAFHALNVPLYVGHSRKSFLEIMTNAAAADRDTETVTTSVHLAAKGVQYLRVHNVVMHRRGGL